MAKITASAFNAVRNKVASVIGTPSNVINDLGYNLVPASYTVASNGKVFGQDYNQVLADVNTCLDHQAASVSPVLPVEKDKLIYASELTLLSAAVDAVYSGRGNIGTGKQSVTSSWSTSIAPPGYWSSYLNHRVRFEWPNNGEFRGWLNLGGFIVIGQSLTFELGTTQDISWTNLLAGAGNIVLGASGAFQNNNTRTGTFPNGGIYNLIANGQLGANASIAFRITNSQDLNYSANFYRVMFYPYPAAATVLTATGFELEFQLKDDYVPSGTTGKPDKVTGATNFSVATYYSQQKTPSASLVSTTSG